jgi:prepilin signal peptidase PulO-like enzyme (type II secretory pathway)
MVSKIIGILFIFVGILLTYIIWKLPTEENKD